MDEENKVLQRLAKQRKHRPSYSRVISWELSHASEEKKAAVKVCHSHVTTNPDDCDEEESDEEFDEEVFSGHSSDEESDYHSCSEDLKDLKLENIEGSSSGAQNNLSVHNDEPIHTASPSRKRLSKKKKKKRRLLVHEFLAPFTHSDDLGIIDDFEDASKTITVQKPVPSLVSLCLRSCRRNESSVSEFSDVIHSPVLSIRKTAYRDQLKWESFQLSWLHRFLAYCEAVIFDSSWLSCDKSKKTYKFLRTLRSISCLSECSKSSSEHSTHGFANLPAISENRHDLFDLTVLSALSTTLDMMLPATVSSRAMSHKAVNQEKAIDAACKTAEIRVKLALQKRYPNLVQHLFEDAAAYAWWSRGNAQVATSRFLSLIEKSVDECVKSMYLNELGRMYNHFGNPALATKYFMQAVETEVSASMQDDACAAALMLSANAKDQGLFDSLKDLSSVRAWNAVLNYYVTPPAAFCAAFESWLCFHPSLNECLKFWEEVERQLMLFVEKSPNLLHHLSLCQAMQGSDNSRQSLNKFISEGGRVFQTLRSNIWQPIINKVSYQGHPIKPMKIIWRRQLVHPSFSENCFNRIVEDHTDNLNLRLTNDGYLTGNMQLALPSMRGIYLDPYTGQLHFARLPCPDVVHCGIDKFKDFRSEADSHIPKIIRISESEECALDLVMSSVRMKLQRRTEQRNISHMALLQWTGPDGQIIKVNLRKLIYSEAKKVIEEQLQRMKKIHKYSNLDESAFRSESLKLLNKLYQSGRSVNYDKIYREVNQQLRIRGRVEKRLGKSVRKVKMYETYYPHLLKLQSFRVFGSVAVLLFSGDLTQHENLAETLVIVNWQEKEKVRQPKIIISSLPRSSGMVCYKSDEKYWLPAGPQVCHPDAKIWGIGFSNNAALNGYYIFNEASEQIAVVYEDENTFPYDNRVADKRLFTISKDRRRLAYTDEDEDNGFLWKETKPLCGDETISSFDLIHSTVIIYMQTQLLVYNGCTMQYAHIHIVKHRTRTAVDVDTVDYLRTNVNERTIPDIKHMKVLVKKDNTRSFADQQKMVTRAVMSLMNRIIVVEVHPDDQDRNLYVISRLDIPIPGCPTDACFISEESGFIIACTLDIDSQKPSYREHVYHFDYDGNILGVLPFLGPRPRNFYPVHLPGKEYDESHAVDASLYKPGWRVYFNDGHGGLACICAD